MKVKLKDICTVNPKAPDLSDDLMVSFVPMPKVGEHGEFDPSDIKKCIDVKKGFTSFTNGDVLFAKITPCMENGKGAIARSLENGYGFGSTEFHVLRPDFNQVTSEWLYYLTRWSEFRRVAEKNMTGSAGQKRVPKSFLENFEVDLPELNAQKEKTNILMHISKLIDNRKQQLSKFDELVKSRFIELFEGKYKTVKLGDVVKTTSGGTPSKAHPEYYENGTIPWLTSGEVNAGVITSVKNYITDLGMKNSSAKIVPANSVVIAMYGATAGVTGLSRLDTTTNQAVCSILPSERFIPEYLYYAVASKKDWMISQCQGGGQPNISQGIIKNMDVIDAPIEEQIRFATFVEQVDKSKFAVQQSLDKLETLKKSLMQKYFG